MKKSFLPFIALLANTYAVTFDTTVHCACGELNQTECGKSIGYCKWTTACETAEFKVSCTETIQIDCTGFSTGYKCAWENSECVEKSYTCGDFTTTDDCPSSIAIGISQKNVLHFLLVLIMNLPSVNLINAQTVQEHKIIEKKLDKHISMHVLHTQNKQIVEVRILKLLSVHRQLMANANHYLEQQHTQTQVTIRADVKAIKVANMHHINVPLRHVLTMIVKSHRTQRTLCAWSGSACADAADTSKLTTDNCLETSYYNYRWTTDGKCQECSDLVQFDSSSNAIILSVLVALALIA